MADTEHDPDAELDEMGRPDPSLEALRERDPEAANAMEMEKLRKQRDRLLERQRTQTLNQFKASLSEEFPDADPADISGGTKAEMRASAKRAQDTYDRIAAKVLAATAKARENDPEAVRRAKEEGWVQPPASATQVEREAPVMSDQELRTLALSGGGKEAKAKILAEYRANGARRIPQESFELVARKATGAAK